MDKSSNSETIKRKKVPQMHLTYRPLLEHLPAYLLTDPLLPVDVTRLCQNIRLSAEADYFEEIYAILPLTRNFCTYSCIVYRDSILLVESPPHLVISNLLKNIEHLEYDIFRKTIELFFTEKFRMIPISTRQYSLFPSGGILRSDTCWINPGQIEEIHSTKYHSIICMENLFSIQVERSKKPLLKTMERSLLTHGIIKREFDTYQPKSYANLLEYLDIHSSKVTRLLLRNYKYQSIPGHRHMFSELYRNNQLEKLARKFYLEV